MELKNLNDYKVTRQVGYRLTDYYSIGSPIGEDTLYLKNIRVNEEITVYGFKKVIIENCNFPKLICSAQKLKIIKSRIVNINSASSINLFESSIVNFININDLFRHNIFISFNKTEINTLYCSMTASNSDNVIAIHGDKIHKIKVIKSDLTSKIVKLFMNIQFEKLEKGSSILLPNNKLMKELLSMPIF